MTVAVALVPNIVGSAASYFLTFRCCNGLAFSPAPGLGYLRWDITLGIWCSLAMLMTLVALLVAFLSKCFRKQKWSLPMLAVIYAILIHQGSTRWAEQVGRHLSIAVFGWDDNYVMKHDVTWVDKDMELQFDKEGWSSHVRMSDEPILSREDCEEILSYSYSHADTWMNSHKAIPPTLYGAFGGDINYAYSRKIEFEPYRPWHNRAPWLSDILPSWNYFYGFKRYMGRETATCGLNQTHVALVQEIYIRGLRPYLEKVRNGLARHMDIASTQIVMGGDEGMVLHDFSPPSVIVGLPNYVRQWDNNYHKDSIKWGTSVIYERLEELGEKPCLGGHHVYGGTLALEVPKDGAGMLWWMDDKENEGYGLQFYTPYHQGFLATVPSTVLHSIAPYQYGGWTDTKRITLQMFMLQCIDEHSASTLYVFH